MTQRSSWCVAALALIALWHCDARSAPGDATRLEYARSEGAASCPDRDALKSAVAKHLGYDPFFPAARQTIVVEITDAPAGLHAQMLLVDERGLIVGSRELSEVPEHCDELVASLALAISIALDPGAALGVSPAADAEPRSAAGSTLTETRAAKGEPPPDAPPELIATATTRHEIASKKPRSKPRESSALEPRIAGDLRAQGLSSVGVAPAVGFGFRLGGSLRWKAFQLGIEFADQPTRSGLVSGGHRAAVSLYQGTLTPCVANGWLAGCALLGVGAIQFEGQDIPNPAKNSSTHAALGARLEASTSLVGRVRVLANLDVVKSLTPVTLRLRGEEVWRQPFLSLSLGLGVAVRFP